MTFIFRIAILALLPALAFLGHGDQLIRRFRGEAAPAGRGGRSGHASVYVWFCCYAACFVLAALRMLLGDAPGVLAAIGILLMAAGVGLRRLAMPVLGACFDEFIRVEPGQPVVDRGVFGLCRHPLHKGLVLEIAGMALVNGHFTALILLGVAVAFFFVRGVQEEQALLAGIGEPYRAYLGRVRSLLDLLPAGWRAYAQAAKPREPSGKPQEPGDPAD